MVAVRQLVTSASLPSQEKEGDKLWRSLSFSFIFGSEPGLWSDVVRPSLVGLDMSLPDTCLLGDLDPRKMTVSVTYHKQGHGFLGDPGKGWAGCSVGSDINDHPVSLTQLHFCQSLG